MLDLHAFLAAELADARMYRELYARVRDLNNFCRMEERVNTLLRVQEYAAAAGAEPIKVLIAGAEPVE